MPRGRRLWVARSVAVLLSLLVGIGLSELAARRLKLSLPYYPTAETAIVHYYTDPNGPVKLTPNWEGYVGGEWTKINDKGFRDQVFGPQPPTGTVRIAVLGDSYTMGDGVPVEATYPKQLEKLLADRFKCEVMNCGVSATNTDQQVWVLREVLRGYRPQIVILGYNINDFQQYAQTRFERLKDAGFAFAVLDDGRVTIHPREYTGFERAKAIAYEHSYLYRWLVSVRNARASRNASPAGRDPLARVRTWVDAGGHLKSFEAAQRMRELCDHQGVSFLVVVLPDLLDTPLSIASMSDYPFAEETEMICENMKARGIQCIDLLPCFASQDPRGLAVHPSNRHYNRNGNELIARAILRPVEDEIDERR